MARTTESGQPVPLGLEALKGKRVIGLRDFALATGLKLSTIRQYKKYPGQLPPDDGNNSWLSNRKDVRDWIVDKLERSGWALDVHGTVIGKSASPQPKKKLPWPTKNPFAA